MSRTVRIAAMSLTMAIGVLTPQLVSTSSSASTGAMATYNGRTIDLADGWQGAHVCVVENDGSVQCFDNAAEAAAVEPTAPSGGIADVSCGSGALNLFQNKSYGGNELVFVGPIGEWIDIDGYGFGNETSSWQNTSSCGALVAKSTNGSGTQLLMPANSESGWIGTAWNDSINSVELG